MTAYRPLAVRLAETGASGERSAVAIAGRSLLLGIASLALLSSAPARASDCGPAAEPETGSPAAQSPQVPPAPEGAKPAAGGATGAANEAAPLQGSSSDSDGDRGPFRRTRRDSPLGAAGTSRVPARGSQTSDDFVPVPDRWRLGFPHWHRYPDRLGAPYIENPPSNPYGQNVLKGDYPIWGQNTFLNLSATSDAFVEFRRRPTPSNVSAARPGSFPFFGRGEQLEVNQTFLLSGELFHGETAFKPRDWAVRFTPAFNVNHLSARETGVVNIDVREGTDRTDLFAGPEELFGEYKLADLSPNYDFVSLRGGVQPFNSDFRGFLFADSQRGARLFGNAKSNRYEYNLAYFRPLEKDTYSGLNTWGEDRGQDIVVANLYKQDFIRPGFSGQLTFAYDGDHPSRHFDNNGVRVRPALIGDAKRHDVEAFYLGFNGHGHLDRFNVSHSFYQVLGRDSHNPIAARSVDLNAQMAAAEVSYDRDWYRLRTALFYASGDAHPRDDKGEGFDAILDNPFFAGAPFSFWQTQRLGLTSTGVDLIGGGSLLPSLRSSKIEGQANYVNPGLLLLNAGTDVDVTPKWRAFVNANWVHFVTTRPLELVLNQSNISKDVGMDYSIGFKHRPWLNENFIITFGASAFVPAQGFGDIFQNKTLFTAFGHVILAF